MDPTPDNTHKSPLATDVNGIGGSTSATSQVRQANEPLVKVEPPRREDLQPSYAKIISPDDDNNVHGWYGSMISGLGDIIGTLGAIPCCIVFPNPFKTVGQGNVGLVTKFGRFTRAVDPGLVKVNPLSERLIQVDVKIQIVGSSSLLLPSSTRQKKKKSCLLR